MRNPAADTVISVVEGQSVQVVLDVHNDAPSPTQFVLQVQGLDTTWVDAQPVRVAAGRRASVSVSITPPARVEPLGAHPFSVVVTCDDRPYAGALKLVLRVDENAVVRAAMAEEARRAEELRRAEDARKAEELRRAEEARRAEDTAPQSEEALRAAEAARQIEAEATRAAEQERLQKAAAAEAERERELRLRQQAAPVSTTSQPSGGISAGNSGGMAPEGVASARGPSTNEGDWRPSVPDDEDVELSVVDFASADGTLQGREQPDEAEEPGRKIRGEPQQLNPPNNSILSVRPGETLLLQFTFENKAEKDGRCILTYNNSLPHGWLEMVRDNVHISAGAKGEVYLRLTPPKNARPASYPFTVQWGPQDGPLEPQRRLVLLITPTPIVRLTAPTRSVTVGPFGREARFGLVIDSIGNVDTAFRLTVEGQPRSGDAEALDSGNGAKTLNDAVRGNPVYEEGHWRYVFDQDLYNLESPGEDIPAPRVPCRLRLQRTGTWWFGFVERHKVRVKAVPVTHPDNGGQKQNEVELTAVRWRITPLAPWVFWPLLFLLLTISSIPPTVTVKNGYPGPNASHVYVFALSEQGPSGIHTELENVTADLSWSPSLAVLYAGAMELGWSWRSRSDTVAIGSDQFYVEKSYFLKSGLLQGASTSVTLIPFRTKGMLGIGEYTGAGTASAGNTRISVLVNPELTESYTKEPYELDVPIGSQHTHLVLVNETESAHPQQIDLWPVRLPSDFDVSTSLTRGLNILQGASWSQYVVTTGPNVQPGDSEDLVFATTDADEQALTIQLKAVK